MKLIHGECKHFKHYSVNYYYIYITTIYIIVNYYSTTHPLILSSANNLLALGNIFYHSQTHTHTYIHTYFSFSKENLWYSHKFEVEVTIKSVGSGFG